MNLSKDLPSPNERMSYSKRPCSFRACATLMCSFAFLTEKNKRSMSSQVRRSSTAKLFPNCSRKIISSNLNLSILRTKIMSNSKTMESEMILATTRSSRPRKFRKRVKSRESFRTRIWFRNFNWKIKLRNMWFRKINLLNTNIDTNQP